MSSIHYQKKKKKKRVQVAPQKMFFCHQSHICTNIKKKKKSIPSSKNINYVRQLIKAKLHKTRDGPKWLGLPLDQKKKFSR